MSPPDVRELVGDDVPPEELARLGHVHDLLVAAGPPPELSPALQRLAVGDDLPDPALAEDVAWLPRRRAGALIALAACLAAVTFGAGYVVGNRGQQFAAVRVVEMFATGKAPAGSLASVEVGKRDSAGNTRLRFHVRGLQPTTGRSYYELYLTRKGKLSYSCGAVRTHAGTTRVELSIPYSLERYSGWVLTREQLGPEEGPHEILLRTRSI